MKVLVTGGAGYVGSHTVVELARAGMTPVIVDNFGNSSRKVLKRLQEITGKAIKHHEADVTDVALMKEIFEKEKPDAVIHFAAHKAVGESVADPLRYYRNNVTAVLSICDAMAETDCRTLIFSSSATVYGDPESVPLTENSPISATNPYGQSKIMSEQILRDVAAADPSWRITILRYFNPVGAHESGLIGEDPNGTPNNLMPYVAQVAAGRLEHVPVFGSDYPTPDGTGVRDYLHVVDLAEAHLKALDRVPVQPGAQVFNLGTGRGHSVMEVINAFERASGKKIAFELLKRRPGDVAECYADPRLAADELGWVARKTLDEMCSDTWNWQSKNPRGYQD